MADDAEIQALLRDFGPDVTEPMPQEVWERLQGVLAAESAARIATTAAPVIHLNRRSSASRRWASGLVAASVVVLAGVVLAGALREDEAPVAADASVLAAPKALAAASVLPGGSFVPPAKHITHSQTDYSLSDFPDQVDDLVADAGLDPAAESADLARTAPEQVAVSPILAKPLKRLRDCVTDVLHSDQRSALLVDLSTFEGEPVGVLLSPTPDPAWLEVSVVDTDCHLTFRSFVGVP